jgi:hypothetical protein
MEAQGEKYSSYSFTTSALDGVSGQRHALFWNIALRSLVEVLRRFRDAFASNLRAMNGYSMHL